MPFLVVYKIPTGFGPMTLFLAIQKMENHHGLGNRFLGG